jgi:ATP/maltotriose-dependent transcriptional regulator MalT
MYLPPPVNCWPSCHDCWSSRSVLVVDDGEQLDGADGALRLLGELIRAPTPSLHVAVASRRPLKLRVAKPRAARRLREFTVSDLAFDAAECAAVLRARHGVEPSPARVDGLMRATEGWPLGVGLAVATVTGGELRRGDQAELRDLRSAPELRSFLSEELFDTLDADLRQAAVESSVARVVTPAVAAALALPVDFSGRIERAGMLIRQVGGEGGFSYHPLVREFLLERLGVDRGEEEQRRLHGMVAPAIAQDGDPIEAIEHWLAARSWSKAVSAIEREGPGLLRKSAGLMRHWLSLLPDEARALPTMLALEGQLEWGAGDHPRAAAVLRNAVRGFRQHPNPPFEWLARFALADSIFATFGFDGLSHRRGARVVRVAVRDAGAPPRGRDRARAARRTGEGLA